MPRKKAENNESGEIVIEKVDKKDKNNIKTIAELAREHTRVMGAPKNVKDRVVEIQGTNSTKRKTLRTMEFFNSKGTKIAEKTYCVRVAKVEGNQERVISGER